MDHKGNPGPDKSQLSVVLAQVNPTVGDIRANALLIRESVTSATQTAPVDLILFGEMVLTGYPIEDLALRKDFQEASISAIGDLAVDLHADGNGEVHVIVGYLDVGDAGPTNSAAVLHRGKVVGTYAKHFLPNYGVFDEARYFHQGNEPLLINVKDHKIAIAICEDLWRSGGPVQWAREAGADILAVLNASPYEFGKESVRVNLCRERAQESGATILYTNIVGGQDELLFDGGSMVISPTGDVQLHGAQNIEELLHITLPYVGKPVEFVPVVNPLETIYNALTLSLRDYVKKNGFNTVIFGASGGIDSALVGAIAVDALGPDRVFACAMPSQYSSEHSLADAYSLAERTGLSIRTIPIAPMMDTYLAQLGVTGLAEENLQARVRGTTLMALSNSEGHLVLAPGNKSEIAVGYSTIYGDAVGGFAPIKDIPKTLVWALAKWRNEAAISTGTTPPIPPNSIEKQPSAELRPDQLDTDSLPDYELLDAILEMYVDQDASIADLEAKGFDSVLIRRIITLTDRAEYKRRQYPPGTKISSKSFGRDRRLPITNRWKG
jgi:NAD+ synthase (glutamine-hydrolysing)